MAPPFVPSPAPALTLQAPLCKGRGALALTPGALTLVDNEAQDGLAKIDLGSPFALSLSRDLSSATLFLELRQRERGKWTALRLRCEAQGILGIESIPPYSFKAPSIEATHFLPLLSRLAACHEEGLFPEWHPKGALEVSDELKDATPEIQETMAEMARGLKVSGPDLPRKLRALILTLTFGLLFAALYLFSLPILVIVPAALFAAIFVHINLNTTFVRVEGKTIVVDQSAFSTRSIDASRVTKVFIDRDEHHYQIKLVDPGEMDHIQVVLTESQEKALALAGFLEHELELHD